VVGTHAVGRPRTISPGVRRVTGGDATSHVEPAVWRLWFPARPGGDHTVVGGPPRQAARQNVFKRTLCRAHSRPAVALGNWIAAGAGLFRSGLPRPPTSLICLQNGWDSLVLGEFGTASLANAWLGCGESLIESFGNSLRGFAVLYSIASLIPQDCPHDRIVAVFGNISLSVWPRRVNFSTRSAVEYTRLASQTPSQIARL